MSFEITIQTPAGSAAVLRAIRDDLREWRESAIPADGRRAGVLRVYGSVKRDKFKLWAGRQGRSFAEPVLHGRILPVATGGSTIIARCDPEPRMLFPIALIAGVIAWNLFRDPDVTSIVPMVFVAAVFAVVYGVQRATVTPDLAEARILAERLRNAVARIDADNSTSRDKPANVR